MAVAAAVVLMVAAAVVAMVLVVVMALCGWVIGQGSSQKAGHRLIGGAGYTAVELNTRLCQGCPGTASNATADQGIYTTLRQQTSQSAVAAPIGAEDGRRLDCSLSYIIDFELLRVAKVLKHLTVLIGHRDLFHSCFLLYDNACNSGRSPDFHWDRG